MLRGFYTAASGMMAQQRRQEVLSNNMTNAQTPGYKQDQAPLRAFPELLIQRMENRELPTQNETNIPTRTEIGSINTGTYVHEAIPDFSQSSLRETGVSTDMAIVQGETPDENGAVFFSVQNGEGEERYTRNGNFTVDGEGFLTTNHGFYVLDNEGNPIQTDGQEFDVTENGVLNVGEEAIPLDLAYSADPNELTKNGQDVYELDGDADPLADARATAGLQFNIQQNHLENSNVDPAQTMVQMMQAYRAFESSQKAVQAYDQSMDKAVNQIARLR
ncbi:flagellar hook-basal body complex protein FlhO [Gracilibacillus halophilus YIM-C55.5]|uniref:Flagellar hook-basal body complex protein FlhO n=1 Tax=Gracilibacillus halophilus YIM-C55.5 TaxID=1308866 RepID=N4WTZ7_9BACI|nr:flagellar hook-basal body protein [Gracilibacillus halophilus]ENH96566.1 flagellar hook-basal body complex protein FlhO [Gracilibacillus halophilus YIM-C55.5]